MINKYVDIEEEMESSRKIIINVFSELLCNCNSDGKEEKYIFKILANLAIWTVTEIKRDDTHKYINQRYISEGVYNKWIKFSHKTKSTNKQLISNDEGKAELRHEHVISRKSLIKDLKKCSQKEEIALILKTAIACVVTLDEDKKLKNDNDEGWERYKKQNIRVYDRKENIWISYL